MLSGKAIDVDDDDSGDSDDDGDDHGDDDHDEDDDAFMLTMHADGDDEYEDVDTILFMKRAMQ